MASADAGPDRDAAGGTGGREAGPDAPPDAPADRREDDVVDAPPGPLAICSRLANVQTTLSRTVETYIGALRGDCRVSLLTRGDRAASTPQFGNQLRQFNFSLWGCDSRPLAGFHIIYQPTTLTLLDVAALIDIYVDVARPQLGLSTREESLMRGELQRLGVAALTSNAQTYSYSECDAGSQDAGDASDGTISDAEVDATPDAEDDAEIGADQ